MYLIIKEAKYLGGRRLRKSENSLRKVLNQPSDAVSFFCDAPASTFSSGDMLSLFSIFIKNNKREGITKMVKMVETAIPPKMTLPSPLYSSDPGPGANTSGSIPNILVVALI